MLQYRRWVQNSWLSNFIFYEPRYLPISHIVLYNINILFRPITLTFVLNLITFAPTLLSTFSHIWWCEQIKNLWITIGREVIILSTKKYKLLCVCFVIDVKCAIIIQVG